MRFSDRGLKSSVGFEGNTTILVRLETNVVRKDEAMMTFDLRAATAYDAALNSCTHISPQCSRSHDRLVEETKDLASDVLSPGLLVVHDASRGGEDDETELTRGQELGDPLLHVAELDVVARADDAGLVETVKMSVVFGIRTRYEYIPAVQLDDDLAVAVVIDLLELANVA